jgi:hypothetical protein
MAPRHPVSQVPEPLSGAIGSSFEPGPVIAKNRERSHGHHDGFTVPASRPCALMLSASVVSRRRH